MGAHVFYELGAGVGMPGALRLGPAGAAATWAVGTATVLHGAGRHPEAWDPAYDVLDATYLAAVLAHLAGWPRVGVPGLPHVGLPWLRECEGMRGPVVAPYNVIVLVSGLAALAALGGSARGRLLGVVVPALLVPSLVRSQHRQVALLGARAQRRPAWWNRRLAGPAAHARGGVRAPAAHGS